MGLKHHPRVVTNGLVYYLDAANPRSYSGSGLTAYSLIGDANGAVNNGTGFTTSFGGAFVFDGSNDHIQLDKTLLSGTQDFTISLWIEGNGVGSFGNFPAGNLQVLYGSTYLAMWLGNSSAYTASPGTYYRSGPNNFVVARSNGSDLFVYYNTLLIDTGTSSVEIGNTTNYRIGLNTINTEPLNGKVYSLTIYNRALTAQEVLQNYNATKKRYGL
jgi:hypothetical protein